MRAVSFAALIALAAVVAVQGVSIHDHHQMLLNAEGGSVVMSANGDGLAATPLPFAIPPYQAPKATDCRSPCPALNTLANHGLLPRDGKGITYQQLKDALIGVYHLGPTFGFIFARAATKKFADPATGTISLCDLLTNLHNSDQPSKSTGIEHSGSLSREDRPSTDFSHKTDATQRSPSRAQVNILTTTGKSNVLSTSDFMDARKKIWAKSYAKLPALKTDPEATKEHIIADVEGCLLLGALSGNSNEGKFQIHKFYAESFLYSERFPDKWQPSERALGIPQLLECLTGLGYAWAKNEFSGMVELAKHWFGVE